MPLTLLGALFGRLADRWSRSGRVGSATPEGVFRARVRTVSREGDRAEVDALLRQPAEAGWDPDDFELEIELLEARRAVLDLEAALADGRLPEVVTQHKAVANEVCHLIVPVSVTGEEGEASGKLFVTSRRLRVVGGRGLAIGWSAVRDVRVDGRSLILTGTNAAIHLLQCNSIADAWAAAVIARALMARLREPGVAARSARPDPAAANQSTS